MGKYSSTVKEQYVPYIYPSENGGKADVLWCSLQNQHGQGVFFTSGRSNERFNSMQVSVSEYSIENLTSATHTTDLNKLPHTEICLDSKHAGIGGENSWMPVIYPPHQVLPPSESF